MSQQALENRVLVNTLEQEHEEVFDLSKRLVKYIYLVNSDVN
jgi:hypothetical protein